MATKTKSPITDDPRDKTYREHFRHALSLCTNLPLTPEGIDEIIEQVAQDEGLKKLLPDIDSRMAVLGDEQLLLAGWECTKLYASVWLEEVRHVE